MKIQTIHFVCYFLVMIFSGPITIRAQMALPYKELGWTAEEAAQHLLNRLAYGARPGEVAVVVEMGIEKWLDRQLNPTEEKEFEAQLVRTLPALGLSLRQINLTYPSPAGRLIVAGIKNHMRGYKDGKLIDSLQVNEMLGSASRQVLNVAREDPKDYPGYEIYQKLTKRSGFKDFNSLMYQLMAQKMLRAVESENQLQEVLTDFWFNHFNVSVTRVNDVANQVLSYERDAIRPHVLGNFGSMLHATAKHPAMLVYLNNDRSNAEQGVRTLVPYKESRIAKKIYAGDLKAFAQMPGVNENYARELLELHTLGVDGGYDQKDVEELARIFTGWKASPFMFPYAKAVLKVAEWGVKRKKHAVLENGFLFDPERHDATAKQVLGQTFPPGSGVKEGYRALDMLTRHPSTARHIAAKMAQYFVADRPPHSLVEKMAIAFRSGGGNIKEVIIAMVEAPEFWVRREESYKLKSPFDFIVSACRHLNVEISDPVELLRWCTRMGQPLYAYQAPTGYPDETSFWVNGTGILKRIDFGLLLATNGIEGVRYEASEDQCKANGLVLGAPEFQYQ